MKRHGTLVIALVLAGCSGSTRASGTAPAASPTLAVTAPASPSSAPTSGAATATFQALSSGATWKRIGAVARDSGVAGVLVFDGRLVAYGSDRQSLPWVWTSSDGKDWKGIQLGRMIQPCPGGAQDYDSQVYAGATDGRQVVLVGLEYALDAPTCGTHRAASWVSGDAESWERGDGFGGGGSFADSKKVWATGSGWEALAWTGSDQPLVMWHSADGRAWSTSPSIGVPATLDVSIGIGADGTRLMVVTNDADGSDEIEFGVRGGESRLRSSSDGASWEDVAFDFNDIHGPTRLRIAVERAPSTGNAWLVVGERGEGGPADVWRSTGLASWERGAFPKAVVSNLAWTRYGYLASGSDVGCGDGGECPPNPTRQFISQDGLTWKAMSSDLEAQLIVDGPTGVLAIDGDAGVWILE